MKIFERRLDYHFPLNSFKISQKSSDFAVQILNFLWRSGGFAPPPEPTYPESTELSSFFLGGQPANFRKKLKMQEENLGKIHKNSLASGGSAPELPGRIEFSIILRFLSNSLQKIHAIFVKLLNFTLPISTNFLKNFLPSGGSAPRAPHYSMSIQILIFSHNSKFMARPKIKKFSEKSAFFSNFLNIFSIFY